MTCEWPIGTIHIWGRVCGKTLAPRGHLMSQCEHHVNARRMFTTTRRFTPSYNTGCPPVEMNADLQRYGLSTGSTDATTTTTLIYLDKTRGSHFTSPVWTTKRVLPLATSAPMSRGRIHPHGSRLRKGPTT